MLQAPVEYEGRRVGQLDWKIDRLGVQVTVDCVVPPESPTLLRCYANIEDSDTRFLLGVLEPEQGHHHLSRRLSRETLRAAGCLERPPHTFFLSPYTPYALEEHLACIRAQAALHSQTTENRPGAEKEDRICTVSVARSDSAAEERTDKENTKKNIRQYGSAPSGDSNKKEEQTIHTESCEPLGVQQADDHCPVGLESFAVLQTKDCVLDDLFRQGRISMGAPENEVIRLHCPFDAQQPFALAPAFALCQVVQGQAILYWKQQDNK